MATDQSSVYKAVRSEALFAGAAARRSELRIAEVSDLGALDRAAWRGLVASAPDGTVFQTFDWLMSWWDAFGGRRRPLVLTAHRDAELVGAAPLLIDDAHGRRGIRFIGEEHADYLTFLARDGASEVVEHLLEYLERRYGAQYDLHLVDVPDTSMLGSLLQRRQRRTPLRVLRTEITPCPRLKIRGNDWRVDEALRKKSLRRHVAKLAARGTVEVRHLTNAREILAQLEQLFEQHRRRWAVTPFPSPFEAQADRRFYRNLVQSGLCDSSLVFTTMSVGGRLAACHFGLVSGADFIWYKPSFDPVLSRCSPGEVLLRELLLLAQERGFEYFDFTRGAEAFKSRFSSDVRYNGSYLIYASHVAGLVARTRAHIQGVLQRAIVESSPAGRLLRHAKRTFVAARQAGAGLPQAALACLSTIGSSWRRWLISRRTVRLFSGQGQPVANSAQSHRVREANLEYLLASPNRLAELLAENKQFLIIAHRRLAQGERCFVIEEEESVAAVGWASRRSPHSIREAAAALHVPGGAVVLYDFHQRSCGLYPQLLMGIRLGVGAEHALIYADDADAALLEAIHSAGFRSEGTVENRVVAGRRRVASRPSLTRALSWEITPEESSQRQTFLTIPQHSLDFLRFWRRIADTIARTVGL